MIKLREKMKQYQELCYLAFVLAIGTIMSMGLESHERPYQIVFAVVFVLWAVKIFTTDFTIREIIWMGIITILLGLNFIGNHEKTLILTAMGIFGAKNISLEKVYKYGFWLKLTVTVGTLLLAAVGLIDNTPISLPKNGIRVELYGFGYGHPNIAFGNIFLIFTLAILAYGDKLKWYIYLIFTVVMFGAYYVFMCRTGILVWICLLIMLLGYKLSRRLKYEKIYLSLFSLLPFLLAALVLGCTVLAIYNSEFSAWIDFYLTGRIGIMISGLGNMKNILIGQIPRVWYDNLNFYVLYNYGIITLFLYLTAYTYAIWICFKERRDYEVIILGAIALYSFMEYYPLSTAWNLSLLCLSKVLFKKQGA